MQHAVIKRGNTGVASKAVYAPNGIKKSNDLVHNNIVKTNHGIWIILWVLLAGSALVGLSLGAYQISPQQIFSILGYRLGISGMEINDRQAIAVVEVIRLPRLLFSMVAGAVLAGCGAAIQGLFRNPLADPGLIGISTGAAVAAAASIVGSTALGISLAQGWGILFVSGMAFAGALAATLLVYALATHGGRTQVATMLLAGIAMAAIGGAIIGMLVLKASDAQLRSITFWSLGSLGGIHWGHLAIMVPIAAISLGGLWLHHRGLNLLALGETDAQYTGIRVERLKSNLIVLVALGVGATVSMCGAIGFIGLVVPHAVRMVLGASHYRLLPASMLVGAILLSLADTFCRTVFAPVEIPIGLATSAIGAPFFVYLLLKFKRQNILL
jgi:iron complex transport system permease protein